MTSQMLEIFTKLTKNQQDTLSYARTHQICQYVEYEPGKYLGVDAGYNSKLIVEEEDGLWSLGRIKTLPESTGTSTSHQGSEPSDQRTS